MKEPEIQLGRPLPADGTCKHYKKSYRWFRWVSCDIAVKKKNQLHELRKFGSYKPNSTCWHKKFGIFPRFPCCGKCYPCDICHEEKEGDHEMLLATRMICGHCCKEQPFAMDKACVACKQSMTHVRTQHWEGGKGCRDRIKMGRSVVSTGLEQIWYFIIILLVHWDWTAAVRHLNDFRNNERVICWNLFGVISFTGSFIGRANYGI